MCVLVLSVVVLVVIGMHAVLLRHGDRSVEGPLEFMLHETPDRLPVVAFNDERGKPVTLDAFRGKLVLLHLWATSVPAAAEELRSLDRLQQHFVGERLEFIALSVDTGENARASVGDWYRFAGVQHLEIYHDPTGNAAATLAALHLPTTLLLDAEGRELGRTSAVLQWDSEAAFVFVREQLALRP